MGSCARCSRRCVDAPARFAYAPWARRMLDSNVLVLNRSYLPIHVTSVRRAFSLIYCGTALAVNGNYETFDFDAWTRVDANGDEGVGTPYGKIRLRRVNLLL